MEEFQKRRSQRKVASLKKNYRLILRDEYRDHKCGGNGANLRTFARNLGVSPATLSSVMNEKRHFSEVTAIKVAKALRWSAERRKNMFTEIRDSDRSTRTGKIASPRGISPTEIHLGNEESDFLLDIFKDSRPVSLWTLFAISHLAKVPESRFDPDWIADTLQIPPQEVRQALLDLQKQGYIANQSGKLALVQPLGPFVFESRVGSVLDFQKKALEQAWNAIQHAPKSDRLALMRMLPVRRQDLMALESLIWNFFKALERKAQASKSKPHDEVYCLSLVLHPVAPKGKTKMTADVL